MKAFYGKRSCEVKELFYTYGEYGPFDEKRPNTRFLTLAQFGQMCIDKDIFTPKHQAHFIKSMVNSIAQLLHRIS